MPKFNTTRDLRNACFIPDRGTNPVAPYLGLHGLGSQKNRITILIHVLLRPRSTMFGGEGVGLIIIGQV